MDKMRCRREAFQRNPNVINTPRSQTNKTPDTMDIDKVKKKTDQWRCFKCGSTGHLIQNCPDSEGNHAIEEKQDF
jgi:hypothetical protein